MKIVIKNYTKNADNTIIEYLIEREKQTYNNIVETVVLNNSETAGLTENEVKTLGFKKVEPIAIRVFTQIEPLDEVDNPVDFILVDSAPKHIVINGISTLTVGQSYEYSATVYDQYGMPLECELTWINKVITATNAGLVKVTASIGSITSSLEINIIERVKTKDEIELDERTSYMIDIDYRLSKIETGVI